MKKRYISYFPYINKYKGTCQFCEEVVEAGNGANTKNFDGEWNTTCDKCYGKVQGVVPTSSKAMSVSTGKVHTLFECAECRQIVAYVKSKKTGKYYLANTYDKGYDNKYGIKRVWDFSPHYKDCQKEVKNEIDN